MLRVLLTWALILPQRWGLRRSSARPASAALYPLLAVLAPACLFLPWLDAFPLRDNNEGLYAEIAREMLATGRFLEPHLNGVPYI